MAVGEAVVSGMDTCPSWAPVLGFAGSSICVILANWGAAWGTWKSGLGLCKMGINHPGGIIKNLVAIIMAGVLGIYGLIVAILISGGVYGPENGYNQYSQYTGYAHLAAGLCCGLSCLAAGGCIGIIGEMGVLATGLRAEGNHARSWRPMPGAGADEKGDKGAEKSSGGGGGGGGGPKIAEGTAGDENKLFVGMLIMLIFSEALALYGLIVALIISQNSYKCSVENYYQN